MSDSPAAILHNTSGTEVGTAGNPLRTEPAGSTAQPVTATSLPLPTGAATSVKQPAIGTAGTPSADVISVQGVSGGTPQPVSGTVTAAQATAASLNATVTQGPAGATAWPVSDGGSSLTVDGPLTDTQLRATAVPVSGTVTASGPLTDAQLRATAVPVSGPLTDTQLRASAVPVSAAALPLPSGASTSALQTTGNTSLGNLDTKTPALGQAAMAASSPVVIANNQTAVPVSGPLTDTQLRATAVPVSGSFSSAVIPNPTDTTGTITALNGVVSAAVQGWSSCVAVVTGTWVATLVFELSSDGGTTWYSGALATPPAVVAPMPVPLLSVAANGTYQGVGLGAVTNVRIRASAFTSGTVNVRLVFGNSAAGLFPGFTSIQQNVLASLSNNSTANLAAGATFTGASESSLGVAGLQVNCKASQPILLQVQQSPDGTNWDISDELLVETDEARGRTFQAIASYFRVLVTNIGNATTTYLRLQTALCPVVEVVPRTLTPNGNLRLASMTDGWAPDPKNHQDRSEHRALLMDVDRNLNIRGRVLTDEASFRDDFTTANPYVDLAGTVYFTNGSTVVTGVGTAFLSATGKQTYLKLSGHADTAYVLVGEILSDTHLTLSAAYTGATGSGTGRTSYWKYALGTGASVAYATSEMGLASGTTSGTSAQALREGDYLPYTVSFRSRISQRIANQEAVLGLADLDTSPENQALFVFDGTVNTVVKCRSSSAAADIEETTVTLPFAATTATAALWRVEVMPERVIFFYNEVKLAEHKNHIPGTYAPMNCYARVRNTGTAGSTTTLYVDVFSLSNHDIVQIGTFSKGDPLATKEARASNAVVTSVAAAVADTVLLAQNQNRMGASVTNDGVAMLYLKLGTGASTTSHTVQIPRGGYYEIPFGYTGPVNGYWSAATGNARITEVTQ